MPLHELHQRPVLHDAVLLVALEGWIDAGLGAAAALATLLEQVDTEPVATFHADDLLDHRSRRPVMHLEDGINTGLTWATTEVRVVTSGIDRDLLLLVGAEPDFRWRQFTDEVVTLAVELGVTLVVGFGAYPGPAPHTRPIRLATTATTTELAQLADVRATLDVPAGVHAAIERRCAEAGIPAAGLWAQVPHYASAIAYPAASALLLDRLRDLTGITVDTADLHEAAAATRVRLDALVENSTEHQQLVRQLEAMVDAEAAGASADAGADTGNLAPGGRIPSGDELAAELQRFLRQQGDE